ncbi:hypothetical protein [Halorhabdus amylolytica]|uniref:hypothetical protein n=1 Tax=Halorhabdus amylolytica TaxID=2559573 RepID=UPI0010AACF91|nr:hypothetical protein [Halorhabdus amylolytica]
MTTNDPSTQECTDSESDLDDLNVHSDVLAVKLTAQATIEDTLPESVTEEEAATIVSEHVEPARRALIKPGRDRTKALRELQAALLQLQTALFGEETDSEGCEPPATVEVSVQVPRDVARTVGAGQR